MPVKYPPAAGGGGSDYQGVYNEATEWGYQGGQQEFYAWLTGDHSGPSGAGADGKSAYQLAVEHGYPYDETSWLASLQGAAGGGLVNWQSGKWNRAPYTGSTSGVTLVDTAHVYPLWVTGKVSIEQLSVTVSAKGSGAILRFGMLANASATNNQPASLSVVAECSVTSPVIGANTVTLDTPLTFDKPTLVWVVVRAEGSVTVTSRQNTTVFGSPDLDGHPLVAQLKYNTGGTTSITDQSGASSYVRLGEWVATLNLYTGFAGF